MVNTILVNDAIFGYNPFLVGVTIVINKAFDKFQTVDMMSFACRVRFGKNFPRRPIDWNDEVHHSNRCLFKVKGFHIN